MKTVGNVGAIARPMPAAATHSAQALLGKTTTNSEKKHVAKSDDHSITRGPICAADRKTDATRPNVNVAQKTVLTNPAAMSPNSGTKRE